MIWLRCACDLLSYFLHFISPTRLNFLQFLKHPHSLLGPLSLCLFIHIHTHTHPYLPKWMPDSLLESFSLFPKLDLGAFLGIFITLLYSSQIMLPLILYFNALVTFCIFPWSWKVNERKDHTCIFIRSTFLKNYELGVLEQPQQLYAIGSIFNPVWQRGTRGREKLAILADITQQVSWVEILTEAVGFWCLQL